VVRRIRRGGRTEAATRERAVVSPQPEAAPPATMHEPEPAQTTDPPLIPKTQVDVDEAPDRPAELIVLLPSLELNQLTGGPNTALHLGARVAERGIRVRFVATHGGVAEESGSLANHLALLVGRHEAPLPATFESVLGPGRPLRLARHDVVLATWWPTAYLAAAATERTGGKDFLYLIQDFEPAFYAWSTNYALALATYSMPMRAIFNERLVFEHFVAGNIGRFGDGAAGASITFDPAVDGTLFRPRARGKQRRLLFYARPSKPRNLYQLGLRVLRRAAEDGTFRDWDVRSIGEPVPELDLGGGAVLRPMPWRDVEGYAELLGTSDILLSLMLSPHPSYPPLEMAASGGAVVTNSFGVKTPEALARVSPRIRAVEPDVEALAAALRDAAGAPPDTSPARLGLPESWDVALSPVVDWIVTTSFEGRT
jgi:beta-1,2-rhamnosyltransferase WsaF-like protein